MGISSLMLVLPAYNEMANLASLLGRCEEVFGLLRRLGYECSYVIVDDGSTDGTAEFLQEYRQKLPVTVITHDPNQGLGPTIRDGLKRASELADDDGIIFAMDADNTHPPGLMIRMTKMILEGSDIVIASRYRPGARVVGLSASRRLMSFGARLLFRAVFPIPGVRDYTCGYRAYRARALKAAFRCYGERFVEHRGFQCMADILLKLSRLDLIMNEAPMILRYDLKGGQSKMQVGATAWSTLKMILQRRFERAPDDSARHLK